MVPWYDNGERFDLRLPYADQGYVDEDADVMGKMANFFGFGKKGASDDEAVDASPPPEEAEKKGWW